MKPNEFDAPDYPEHIERKIAKQQRRKEQFSFYHNLSSAQKVDIALFLLAIVAFVGLLSLKPSITGFYFLP